jgi:hypothetical protein
MILFLIPTFRRYHKISLYLFNEDFFSVLDFHYGLEICDLLASLEQFSQEKLIVPEGL